MATPVWFVAGEDTERALMRFAPPVHVGLLRDEKSTTYLAGQRVDKKGARSLQYSSWARRRCDDGRQIRGIALVVLDDSRVIARAPLVEAEAVQTITVADWFSPFANPACAVGDEDEGARAGVIVTVDGRAQLALLRTVEERELPPGLLGVGLAYGACLAELLAKNPHSLALVERLFVNDDRTTTHADLHHLGAVTHLELRGCTALRTLVPPRALRHVVVDKCAVFADHASFSSCALQTARLRDDDALDLAAFSDAEALAHVDATAPRVALSGRFPALARLAVRADNLSAHDVDMPALRALDLSCTAPIDLARLGCPPVESLTLHCHPDTDLAPLARWPALRSLELHASGLPRLRPLSSSRSLRDIDLVLWLAGARFDSPEVVAALRAGEAEAGADVFCWDVVESCRPGLYGKRR